MQNESMKYWWNKKPSYWRRANWHDYTSRCIYMITMVKSPEIPRFAEFCPTEMLPENIISKAVSNTHSIVITPTGSLVKNKIDNLPLLFPHISIYRSVIMPDHVHIVLSVEQPGVCHLGTIIAKLKGVCSRGFTDFNDPGGEIKTPMFISKYHDRILKETGQLKKMREYVADNPRRLFMKMQRPEWFRMRHRVRIGNETFEALGNADLLKAPIIHAIKISRRYTPEQKRSLMNGWYLSAVKGAVLASPFVNPDEKRVRDAVIPADGKLILLIDNGFTERYKPGAPYFDPCAEGRVLVIATEPYHTEKSEDFRQKALRMNALAFELERGNAALL